MTREQLQAVRLAELGQQLRVDAVRASAADLMAVLLSRHLRFDFDTPDNPGN